MRRKIMICVNLTMFLGLFFVSAGQARTGQRETESRKPPARMAEAWTVAMERHPVFDEGTTEPARTERVRKRYEETLYRPCVAPCDWAPRVTIPDGKAVISPDLRPGVDEPLNRAR